MILKNARHELFARQMADGVPQGEAFIAAGFSKKSSAAGAARLVKKSEVSVRICELRAQKSEVARIDAAWLLAYFGDILRSDIGDIIEKEDDPTKPGTDSTAGTGVRGRYKPIHEWPLIWRQQLRGMDVEERMERSKDGVLPNWDVAGRVVKIKFLDRNKVAELAGMHIGVKAFEAPKQVVEHINSEAVALADLYTPAELAEMRERIRARQQKKP